MAESNKVVLCGTSASKHSNLLARLVGKHAAPAKEESCVSRMQWPVTTKYYKALLDIWSVESVLVDWDGTRVEAKEAKEAKEGKEGKETEESKTVLTPESLGNDCQALILVCGAKEKEKGLVKWFKRWLSFIEAAKPEVLLVVAHETAPGTAKEERLDKLRDWCVDNCMEFIVVPYEDPFTALSAEEVDLATTGKSLLRDEDPEGVPRVAEALRSNMWRNLDLFDRPVDFGKGYGLSDEEGEVEGEEEEGEAGHAPLSDTFDPEKNHPTKEKEVSDDLDIDTTAPLDLGGPPQPPEQEGGVADQQLTRKQKQQRKKREKKKKKKQQQREQRAQEQKEPSPAPQSPRSQPQSQPQQPAHNEGSQEKKPVQGPAPPPAASDGGEEVPVGEGEDFSDNELQAFESMFEKMNAIRANAPNLSDEERRRTAEGALMQLLAMEGMTLDDL